MDIPRRRPGMEQREIPDAPFGSDRMWIYVGGLRAKGRSSVLRFDWKRTSLRRRVSCQGTRRRSDPVCLSGKKSNLSRKAGNAGQRYFCAHSCTMDSISGIRRSMSLASAI